MTLGRSNRTRVAVAPVVCAALLLAGPAAAKIDLVTLPEKASTQLTIYHDIDLTLVRESRTLTFREGLNPIQFSWAETKIDPTSVEIQFKSDRENFSVRDVTFPAGTTATAIWNVEAKQSLSAEIEVVYFISGISWEADYVGMANADETEMRVENFIRVTNQSGEDFERAQVRVVVGSVSLRERILALVEKYRLARARSDSWHWGLPAVTGGPMTGALVGDVDMDGDDAGMQLAFSFSDRSRRMSKEQERMKEIAKEALSEFQLYTIEGTEDLKNGWSRRLRALSKDKVKVEVAYEWDALKYGEEPARLYRSRNDSGHTLGEAPLPGGVWRVYRETPEGGVCWVGEFENKYVPVGEKIELALGSDGQLTLEETELSRRRGAFDWRREDGEVGGYDETTVWRVLARNGGSREVALKVVRYLDGDWTLEPQGESRTMKQERRDDASYVFESKVGGQQQLAIEFAVTTRKGTNAKRQGSRRAPAPE